MASKTPTTRVLRDADIDPKDFEAYVATGGVVVIWIGEKDLADRTVKALEDAGLDVLRAPGIEPGSANLTVTGDLPRKPKPRPEPEA